MSEPQIPITIKFPPKPRMEQPLVLPRRRLRSPFDVSETTAATQKTIEAIRSATRNPWGDEALASSKLADLERSLKQLAAKLEERERYLQDLEVRLADRERGLAETEILMKARESLVEAGRNRQAGAGGEPRTLSHEEQAALEKLKTEVERQQASLKEQRDGIREREAFLDESETKLFQKVQDQQEKETEIEQLQEDLRIRERKLREREAAGDPKLAAALKAEKAAARKYNEFTE